MNKSLVCRVLVPRNKGNPSISTGYAIKAGTVMLAYHALLDDKRDKDQSITLIWEDITDPETSTKPFKSNSKQEYISTHDEYDLAFIECDTPASTPVNLCHLACQKFPADMKWESYGYPIAQQQENEIDYPSTTIGGEARSSNNNGVIELDSTDMESPEEWAGISGAPIFFGSLLAGIIVEKPDPHKNRLEGRSLPYILEQDESFSRLLQIPSQAEEKYLKQALDIIEHNDIFTILTGLLKHQNIDAKQIYSHLLSLSIGEFLENIVDLQEEYHEQKIRLSNLVFSLLPHFIDNMVSNQLRHTDTASITPAPYSHPASIEMLMSRVDQRALAVDTYNSDIFVATYSLPVAPESGDNEQDKIKDGTQDLFQKFGGDLFQINLARTQTNTLLDQTGKAGLMRELKDSEKIALVKRRLERDRRRNKPRYYLICQQEIEQGYYQAFKNLYPDCSVIAPSTEFQQILQEDEDYDLLLEALSPHLETMT